MSTTGNQGYSDADYAAVGEFIGKFFDTSPGLVANTLNNLGMSVADVTKAAQTVAGGQNITQGQVSDYLKTWGGNNVSGGFVPEALAYLRPAAPAAPAPVTPTWTQQNLIDAGNFIAQNMGDYGAIEAARAQIEAATGMNISAADILKAASLATAEPADISKAMADVISGDVYGKMDVKGAYDWINKSIIDRPEFSAQDAQRAMRELGISTKDIATAAKLDPRISAGAQYTLTTDPFYQAGAKSGFAALNENLRNFITEINKTKPTTVTSAAQATDWTKQAEKTLREGLKQGILTSGKALNEYDVQRATGKTIGELFAPPKVTVLDKPTQLPPVGGGFVPLDAPPPGLPPGILTPGGGGIAPGTAIVGAIPESDRVQIPQLDMEFRNSAPRTPVYDRLGRVTRYEYTPAAKLAPATGTNVFNWKPPGVTSRPRQLLSMRDVPGATFDPVTGEARMPLSASQQFAQDRAQLDSDFRSMYKNLAAKNPDTIPAQAPASAAKAFRELALADPEVAQQLRLRNIDYQIADPAKADMALRAKYGQSQAQAAVANLFTPFIDRNLATLQGLVKRKKGQSYSERRPDVAEAYAKMSPEEKKNYPSLLDYEVYHYNTFGKKEDPTLPNPLAGAGKLESPYEVPFLSKGGEASTEDFIKKQSGGDVSRETTSPNTAEVPKVDFKGDLIDENAEMRSESQRMLNRLKTAQQESYRRGKLPPGIQRAVTDVMSEGKPRLFQNEVFQAIGDAFGGAVGATPREPTNPSNIHRLVQAATGAVLPEIPTASVARTAQAARGAVQEPRATMSAAGRSARESLEALADIPIALAQPNQLGAQAGIFRPPGGYFPTSRVPGKSLSNLDMAFEQAISKIQASPDDEKKQALLTLFNQKAKDFFTKQAGSIDDPLRQEILSGRIRFEEGTRMADLFPNQLQKGAAKGDLQSLRLLDKNYDQMLNIKTVVPRRQSTQPSPENVKRQIVQHIKDNLDQIPDAQLLAYAGRKPLPGPVGLAQSAAKVRQSLKDNPGLIETYLVPRIEKTLSLNPTQVTDLDMAKHPSLYAPRAVEQLRSPGFVRPDPKDPDRTDLTKGYFLPEVEQAIEKNQPIYDISSPHFYSLLGMTPDDLLKQAMKLPQRELERISFPQFVKKAYALTQEANERQRLLQQVPQLIKEGKAPPEQIMLAGTKTFLPTSDGFKWIKVTDPDATVAIAKGMSNSVGGYATSTTYGTLNRGRTALERGEAEIYSLYDKNNIPHMTVEYLTNKAVPPEGRTDEAIKNTIAQFTGNGPLTANDKPGQMYVPHIRALVDRLNPTRVPDTIRQLLKNN